MPKQNGFRHQSYPSIPVISPVIKKLVPGGSTDAAAYADLHVRHLVSEVILVPGTFAGTDPIGLAHWMTEVGSQWRFIGHKLADWGAQLAEKTKLATDAAMKDVANYCPAYRDRFQHLVGSDPRVRFLEPSWSSQNHHYARADLAVRLLCDLTQRRIDSQHERVLLWGHSHAGQGFALLTNLLANERDSVRRFFEAAGTDLPPHWEQARQQLADAPTPHPLGQALSIATFGTPVRYGWDTSGYLKLVHVSFHRPPDPEHPLAAKPAFPLWSPIEMRGAKFGDWVQLIGIAGSDIPNPMFREQNDKLAKLIEAGLSTADGDADSSEESRLKRMQARLQTGTRAHADGLNYFVDYAACGRQWLRHPIEEAVFGHGVATTLDWLPRHLELVMDGFSQ